MTRDQMNDQIRTLGERVTDLSARLAQAATQEKPNLEEISRLQNDLQAESARLNALRAAAGAMPGQPEEKQLTPAQERSRKDILKSNEYARAFAAALRGGYTPATGRGMEQLRPLYDALTIGGGDPVGTDGGFLVPEDIDHRIREQQRALNPLREFFNVEPVSTNSGWRVGDAAPSSGFSQVNEMATVPSNDQPAFSKITFALAKYGLILPISNELAADEVANLFAYISRWAAKKETITENTLLLAALASLSSGAVTVGSGTEVRDLKKILNVSLDPAISQRAVILTNQDGFNLLDSLEDLAGRPIMQWDPVTATPRALSGHRVAAVSNAVLPSGEGANDALVIPFYVGDGQEYATLFERNPMEMLSTNIGGTAFTTDSIQIRFIKRMGVSVFDSAAMKLGRATI
ncbi:MAG: phage major capsid protein [Deltaproteobacteria bacterium]|nr:phage major capsid protein [Deltaproteobacteria bacterium]